MKSVIITAFFIALFGAAIGYGTWFTFQAALKQIELTAGDKR